MKRAAETELVGGPKEKHGRADEIVEVQEDDVDTCPICMDVMGIRVMKNIMCTHAVCSACNRDLERCPMCRAEWLPMSEELQKDNVRIICSECNSKVAYTKFHTHVCKGNSCPNGCGWFGKRNCSGSAHPCRLQKCVLCSGEDHLVMKCPKVTEMGAPFTNAKDLPNRDVALLLAKCVESGQTMDSALFQRVMRNKRLHPYAMEHVRVLCENNKISSDDMGKLIKASNTCDSETQKHYFNIASFFPHDGIFVNEIANGLNRKMRFETMAFYVDYIAGKPVEYYMMGPDGCLLSVARAMKRAADWAVLHLAHIPDLGEVLTTTVTPNQRTSFIQTVSQVMENLVELMVYCGMFTNLRIVECIVESISFSLVRIMGCERGLRLLQKVEDACICLDRGLIAQQAEYAYTIHRKVYKIYMLHGKKTELRLLCDKMQQFIQLWPDEASPLIRLYTSIFHNAVYDAARFDLEDGNYERAHITLKKLLPTFPKMKYREMTNTHLLYVAIVTKLGFTQRDRENEQYMKQKIKRKFNWRGAVIEVPSGAEE